MVNGCLFQAQAFTYIDRSSYTLVALMEIATGYTATYLKVKIA